MKFFKDTIQVYYGLDLIVAFVAIISISHDNTVCLPICCERFFYHAELKTTSTDFGCAAVKVKRSEVNYAPK